MNEYNEVLIEYLSKSSPEKWHQVAWTWNWDSGLEPLRWIIENPNCDKGTALLLYWYGGPRFYSKYVNENEVDQYQLEHYKLLKDIENKYITGFYKNENISFDPKNDEEHDWTKEYKDIKMEVKIPEEMYKLTEGQKIKRERLEDGYPEEVLKKVEG